MTDVAEDAVRTYVQALRDPDSLVDHGQVESLRDALGVTEDPVERLYLRNALVSASQVDLDSLESDFVQHAKAWADQQGIDPESLMAEGVDRKVLGKAGFHVGRRRKPDQRVSAEKVDAHISSLKAGTRLSAQSLAEATGASAQTVRKRLVQAVEAGIVEEVGPAPTHEGPGRAPIVFVRKAKRKVKIEATA